MKLHPLPARSREIERVDYETLLDLVSEYRKFVGKENAFQIEFPWWPGTFDTKEEEMDFMLAPEGSTWTYFSELEQAYDEIGQTEAEHYVRMIDAERERKYLGWLVIVLLIPYMLFAYLIFK